MDNVGFWTIMGHSFIYRYEAPNHDLYTEKELGELPFVITALKYFTLLVFMPDIYQTTLMLTIVRDVFLLSCR